MFNVKEIVNGISPNGLYSVLNGDNDVYNPMAIVIPRWFRVWCSYDSFREMTIEEFEEFDQDLIWGK